MFFSCQEEREEALAKLKAIELKHKELKVLLVFWISFTLLKRKIDHDDPFSFHATLTI